MRFTVFREDVPISIVCDGDIEPIPTSMEGKTYVKGVFPHEVSTLVYSFQQGLYEDSTCEIEDDNIIVKGTYVTYSRIDRNPIINVVEKINK